MASIKVTVYEDRSGTPTPYTDYLNSESIQYMKADTTVSGANTIITYSVPYSSTATYIYVAETAAALQTAINAAEGGGGGEETVDAGVTATGTVQGDGYAITADYTQFSTVAAGSGATLQGAVSGLVRKIKNSGANALLLYPAVADKFNGGSLNAAISVDVGQTVTVSAIDATTWEVSSEALQSYTTLLVGTDQTFAKEVDHVVSVVATTTAATAGGKLTITSGAGNTSGNGGDLVEAAGAAGLTGAGGNASLKSGAGGGTSGASGTIDIASGTSTSGNTGTVTVESGAATAGTSGTVTVKTGTGTTATGAITVSTGNATTTAGALTVSTGTAATTGGAITISTGNISAGTSGAVSVTTGTGTTASGAYSVTTGAATTTGGAISFTTGAAVTAGNITLTPGVASSTTVAATTIVGSNLVRKPVNTSTVATSGTALGIDLVNGYLSITGATGNVQLPSTANITTAIGATPAGTIFDFIVNTSGMTANNVATLVVGANMVVAAQTGAGDSASGQLLTITNTAASPAVDCAVFRIVFVDSTHTRLFRIG